MNLYHLIYESTAGQPARREPRTVVGRILRVVWREGLTLMQLNLLFLCACLPVLTIGPALGALAAVMGRLVRDEPVLLWRDYWGAFRKTFRPCFWSGLIVGGGGAGLGAAAAAAILLLPESVWRYALVCGACAVWLILCGAAVYLFALQGEEKARLGAEPGCFRFVFHSVPCRVRWALQPPCWRGFFWRRILCRWSCCFSGSGRRFSGALRAGEGFAEG